jgi:hypothetical protein
MGALIFLLLVTTRMIRDRAVAQAEVEATPAKPALPLLNIESTEPPSVEPEPIVIPAAPDPEPESAEPKFDVRARALADRQRELDELIARWKARAGELATQRDERARALAQQKRLFEATAEQNVALQSELRDMETKLGRITGELSVSAMGNGTAGERLELERKIAELKKRLIAAQASQQSDSKFMVVPFDIHTGTARRPILIECTATGLRFIPEDITVTPADLAGFTPRVNPLIAGAATLVNYWTTYNLRQENPGREPEPYVLLLVRPSGIIAYYVAMKMLSELKQPHGYELIEEDTELQLPEIDVGAQAACEAAVKRLLAERNQLMQSTVAGSGGSGHGRNGGGRGGTGRGTFAGSNGGGTGPNGGIVGTGNSLRADGSGGGTGTGTGPETSAKTGSGDGSSGDASSTRNRPNRFELEDLTTKDEFGSRSWERPESFQGRMPRTVAASQGGPGSPEAQGTPGGMPAAGVGSRQGTANGKNGGAPKTSNGTFAGVVGSPQAANRAATENADSSGDPGQSGESQPSGKSGSAGTTGSASNSQADNGIEKLTTSDSDDASSNPGAGQGSNTTPDIGLGSSGNPSIPVQDHRHKKATGKPRAFEPEQLANHHWGLAAPDAAIGLERDLKIEVEPQRFVVGGKHAVKVRDTDSKEDLFGRLTTVIDLQARDWGEPPHGFFWKPNLQYVIADGGDKNYEQVHTLLERAGLASTKEYANGATAKPVATSTKTTPKTTATSDPKPPRRFFRGFQK